MKFGAPADPDQVQMSFGDHLDDLRRRLIYCLYGVAIASALTFYYGMSITAWLYTPLAHAQRNAGIPVQTYTLTAMAGFTTYMKVAIIAAIVLAAPWLLYQIWQFIALGLYQSERRVIYVLAPFSAVMTGLGVLFSYHILLPLMLTFLLGFATYFPEVPASEPTFVDRFAAWTTEISAWGAGATPRPQQQAPAPKPGNGGDASQTPVPLTPVLIDPADQTSGAATPPPPLAMPTMERVPILEADPSTPTEGEWWVNRKQQELRVSLDGRVFRVALSIPSQNQPLIDLSDFVDFALYMIVAVVIAFQLPVVMLIAGWSGLIDPAWIAAWRKYMVFACFAAGAVISPTGDPFNMTVMALPLYLLFELGLLLMRVVYRRRGEDAEEQA